MCQELKARITLIIPSQEKPKSPKAQVNAVFFHRLYQLLKIGIPGIMSSEFGYVLLVAVALVARTLCDLWLINKGTLIETQVQCFSISDIYYMKEKPCLSDSKNFISYQIDCQHERTIVQESFVKFRNCDTSGKQNMLVYN